MTILLSGAFNPRFVALPEYLAAALRRLGHRVVLFDHRGFLLPGRLRARCAPLQRLDTRLLNERLRRVVRALRPDLLIVNQGMSLEPRTIGAVRASGVRCVNWFSDYPAEFDAGLRAAPSYDMFFLGSSYAAARHREAGHARSFWLPFGCDESTQHPGPDPSGSLRDDRGLTGEPPAIVFVGSHYPERQILLRFLRGLPISVWGPGWERAAGDPHVAPMIRGGAVGPATWRRLYAGCLVALNIHYGSFGPQETSGDLANTRVFEIPACGACQVVDRQGDVLRLFREGVHFAGYSGGDELRATVESLLRDDDRRRSLAAAGRREVMARHTYAHRARHLIEGVPFDMPATVSVAGAGGR